MHIKELSLENFRAFKDKQTFEFAPITVFCGANNSGKSSVLKSLLLLKSCYKENKLSKLYFKGGDHNLGSFETTKNNRSINNIITSGLTVGFFHAEHIIIEKNPDINKCKTQANIFFSQWEDQDYYNYGDDDDGDDDEEDDDELKIIQKFELAFNETELISLDLTDTNGKLIFTAVLDLNEYRGEIALPSKIVNKDFFKYKLAGYSNDAIEQCVAEISDLILLKLTNFQSLKMLYSNKELGTSKRIEFMSSYLDYFKCIKYLDRSTWEKENPFWKYNRHHGNISNGQEIEETNQYNSLTGNIIELINDTIKKYKFDVELDPDQLKSEFINAEFINDCYHNPLSLEMALENLDYLPVLRSTQERLYTFKSQGTVYNQILDDFQVNLIKEDQEWINSRLLDFNIAEKVNIRLEPGIGYWITVKNNGKDYSPVDIGFGFSQLFPILMKIIMNKEGILIIEEPEANLHPKLQSMLADLFIKAFFDFKIQFLIETHSEYLIRKLQYLTAAKVIPTNFTSIHYIESEIDADPKAYQIRILEDGGLTRTFGDGFFDEATNLQFELLKLKQTQLN